MKIAVLCFLVLYSFSTTMFSQDCEQCKQRIIIVYDNNVTVPMPNDNTLPPQQQIDKYKEWTDLYYIAGGVRNYVWNDPTTGCLQKMCAAFFTEPDSINTRIQSGIGHPNIPPDGMVGGNIQYIIYGIVTGSDGNFTLQLMLESARSRETVKAVTVNFSSGFNPIQFGENVAANFGTLYNTILDFEKKKRDEGEPYAIRPRIETVPLKKVMNKNESTQVDFKVLDCDEMPLKNRNIQISAENGSFESQTITTDEYGKASAKFTAGDNTGIAKVQAILVYRMPQEPTAISTSDDGYAYIQIEEQPYWEFICDFNFEEISSFEQNLQSGNIKREIIRKNSGDIYSLIDEKSWGNGIYTTEATVSASILGEYSESMNEQTLMSGGDEHISLYSNEVKSSHCKGSGYTDDREVHININKNNRHFSFKTLVTPMNGGGQSNSLSIYCNDGNCVTNTDFQIIECSSEVVGDGTHSYDTPKGNSDTSYTIVNNISPGYTITQKISQSSSETASGYKFEYKGQEIHDIIQEGMSKSSTVIKEEVNIEINAEISTDVASEDEMLPENFLFQNNPNPFNPETFIRYSLTKGGHVKLIVYDLIGREVTTLVNSYKSSGTHFSKFNAQHLNSGIYFYRIESEGFSAAKKMLLLK